jgi:hypothetical protein
MPLYKKYSNCIIIYNRNLFLLVLEAGNQKMKFLGSSVSGKDTPSSDVVTTSSEDDKLNPHRSIKRGKHCSLHLLKSQS